MTATIIGLGVSPQLARVVARYKSARIAPATERAYTSALRSWGKWCAARHVKPWPPTPQLVEAYVADLASRGRSMSTIDLAVVAISEALRLSKLPSIREELHDVLKGIRRTHGVAPRREARPLLARDLSQAMNTLHGSARRGVKPAERERREARERAFLLTAWTGAMRRDEVVALWYPRDVRVLPDAYVITRRRAKNDPEGKGLKFRVACTEPHEACAACALATWLELRGSDDGPLFGVSARTIARAVQRAARRLGLDPKEFAAHSLRAGLITTAWLAGVPPQSIRKVSGHASSRTFDRYIRGAAVLAGDTPAQRAIAWDAGQRVTSSESPKSSNGPENGQKDDA